MKQMKDSKRPVVLPVNGKTEVVVQDAENYQLMLERLERAETVAAVRLGMEEFERGEGRDAREAFEEMAARLSNIDNLGHSR